jgi:two-component system sensor histidine kinase PilS (NtrC family)
VTGATAIQYPDSFWRSLKHLNGFRVYLGIFFAVSAIFVDRFSWLSHEHIRAFILLALGYAALTWPFGLMLRRRRPGFEQQLVSQLILDSLVLVALMHLGGGKDTGLGLLVMVFMAAAGLHARTRGMLLIPSAATLALLVEQGYAYASGEAVQGFAQAGLLAVGFFMVASLSHVLARGTLAAAELAGAKEQEVASLEKVNARVIQDLPYGVLVVDGRDQLLQANGQASAWLQCRLAPHISLRACAPMLSDLLDAWKRGETRLDTLFKNPDGRHFRARLMELDALRSEGAVIVLEDLSELEQEAQKLKLAALGRLTANLAHEIRNPLSAVRHAAQLLAEDVPDGAPASKLTRIIEDNVTRLNRMVEDVLLLNRRDRLSRESIPLVPFLDDFIAQFQGSERLPADLIDIEVPADIVVDFDRTHLHQILWNLLRNALRHCSRAPGSISIRAAERSGRCVIEVYNDGDPIPPDLLARLFEPFYTTDSRGTGLGLHIARELAEANHAELSCLVRDEGALFRLTCDGTAS